jgi:hypothetical protein
LYWIPLTKYFLNNAKEEDEDVLDGWYNYCFYFLTKVNKEWRDYIAPERLQQKNCIFEVITSSDEAIVRWFLQLWLPILKKELVDDPNQLRKNKGEGPQDIKHNIDKYTNLYKEISTSRTKENKIKWNTLFWKEVEKRNKDMYNKKEKQKYTYTHNKKQSQPLPGYDDDEDLFAYNTVHVHDESDDNLNIEPDNVGS